jgi:hypothetical protein
MSYVRNDFGTLTNVTKENSFVVITNHKGAKLKMSLTKYQESAEDVYQKAKTLIGKEVGVRTSQNTNDWSTDVWFSDIYEK